MMPTEIDKYKIKASFSKSAPHYDIFASFQKQTAEELASTLPAGARQLSAIQILDIGCGTGFLTHYLAKLFPKANIIGCDISHSMIKVASRKLQVARGKKIHLITTDGEILPCKNGTFDFVTSSLTYQWLSGLDAAFSEARRTLKPGGIFVFATLGPDTLKELRCCYTEASAKFNKDGLPPFMGFSEKQDIRQALKKAGFKNISIETTQMVKTYPNMWALLKTMKSIGAGNPFKQGDKSLARGSILKRMEEVYKTRFKTDNLQLATCNCIYATYEAMFVKAANI